MPVRRTLSRARLLTVIGLGLYAVVVLGAPFEHHDLVCHLKTPQHCTSCASSQLGSDPHALSAPGASHLDAAGFATTSDQVVRGALLAIRRTGRSPPRAV